MAKVKQLVVTQIKSSARCVESQVLSLKALGLGRIGKKSTLKNDDCINGLIRKVSHLIKVEDSNE